MHKHVWLWKWWCYLLKGTEQPHDTTSLRWLMSVVLREVSKLNVQPQPLCNHPSFTSIYISLTCSFGLQHVLRPTLAQITQAHFRPGVYLWCTVQCIKYESNNMEKTFWAVFFYYYLFILLKHPGCKAVIRATEVVLTQNFSRCKLSINKLMDHRFCFRHILTQNDSKQV